MGRHRTLGGLAVIATAVAVPMLLFMRTRPRDYRRTREFRALVGDYVISSAGRRRRITAIWVARIPKQGDVSVRAD